MALILLRNCFKDVGVFTDGKQNIFQSELIKDLTGFILIMLLVWLFHSLDAKRSEFRVELSNSFIKLKDKMTNVIMIIFFGLSIYSFTVWLYDLFNYSTINRPLGDPSHIFYKEFFTLLTFVDVLLLLSSAKNLKNTVLIIRNSGYVLATFLLRISFSLIGWERIAILVIGASVAVFMLWISNRKVFLELKEE
jgi:hypothetical protein